MSNVKPYCVFCGKKTKKLQKFVNNTLNTCTYILSIRKEKNLHSNNVVLPGEVNDYQRYHSACYSKFTAVQKKYKVIPVKDKPSESTANLHVLEDESIHDDNSAEPSTSKANVNIDSHESCADEVVPQSSDLDMHINTKSVEEQASKSDKAVTSGIVQKGPNPDQSLQASTDDLNANQRCIFCDKERKHHKSHWQTLHVCQSEDAIKSIAEAMNDHDLVAKISDACGKNQIILYHKVCKQNYEYQLESQIAADKPKSKWHIMREVHKIAYDEVCSHIRENVIDKKSCFFLNFYIRLYVEILQKECEVYEKEDLCIDVEADFHLEKKLVQTFPKEITIVTLKKKKVVKPYTGVSSESIDLDALENQDILQRAALILRREINEIKRQPLPDQLQTSDLIKGECALPTLVTRFYEILLGGLNYHENDSTNSKRSSESFSADLIYAVTDGKLKPSKHITLGLAIKGLTNNSENVVSILNKYGHCCDNTTLEKLETEATNQLEICPEEILRAPNLCTGVAFKNVDCFVDTPSGKNKVHNMVGIIYQNIDDTAQNNSEIIENIVSDIRSEESTKRTHDAVSHELESDPKKPRLAEFVNPTNLPTPDN